VKCYVCNNFSLSIVIVAAAGVLVSISAGTLIAYSATATPHAPFPLTVDGVQCNPSEQLLFHIHAHLDIIINGHYFLVPAQIGINYINIKLHAHDEIAIVYGTPPPSIPSNYDFPEGL